MTTVIVPHSAYKPNWRYAKFVVAYDDHVEMSTATVVESHIMWYSPKNVLLGFSRGGNTNLLYGMPTTWPIEWRTNPDGSTYKVPKQTVTTDVNTNDASSAKTVSYIFGWRRGISSWVPWHIFNFRVPIEAETTYTLTNNYSDFWVDQRSYVSTLVECEFLGESVDDPYATYPTPRQFPQYNPTWPP